MKWWQALWPKRAAPLLPVECPRTPAAERAQAEATAHAEWLRLEAQRAEVRAMQLQTDRHRV